jgi:ketosteroid isomerase-like protein
VSSEALTSEALLRRLHDRVSILETLYRYCRHADQLDPAGMAALFTEDCVLTFFRDGPTLRGRAAVQARLAERLAVTVSGSHHLSNEEVIFEGADAAKVHAYMYSWQRFLGWPGVSDVHRWGRYEVRLKHDDEGCWRISRMRLLSAGEYGSHRIGEHLGQPWPPEFAAETDQ